jgi:hypothetical protein
MKLTGAIDKDVVTKMLQKIALKSFLMVPVADNN